MSNPTLATSTVDIDSLSESEQREKLELFLELEPYLARCFTLNHDLNNPLTGILGYGEFILSEDERLPDDIRDQVKKMLTCAERIRDAVEELCDIKIDLSERVDFTTLLEKYQKESPDSN